MHARKAALKKHAVTAATPVSEEQPFPRGGGGASSVPERRRPGATADGFTRASKRRRVSAPDADAWGAKELRGKSPKFVSLLKFKALTVGSKVWGAVAEVTAKELIISLPHGLRGHVAPAEASEPLGELLRAAAPGGVPGKKTPRTGVALSELFYIGQLVRATVIDLQEGGEGSKKRISLSLRVGLINSGISAASVGPGTALPAAVKGVEDHGYTLSFGIKGLTGFLKKSTHEDAYGNSAELKIGMLVEVAVTAIVDRRLAHVTTEPTAVAGSVVKDWDGLDIGSLTPGALVNARIRTVLADGLLVSFLTYFNGTIDRFHLTQELPSPDWQSSFSAGQRLRARILFIDPTSKAVFLSVQRHLVNASLPETLPAVGTNFEGATVRRVDAGFGVLLGLPGGGAGGTPAAGFAHVSNLSDERLEKIEKAFRVGQTVKARVIGHRPMDGLVVLSLRPSVIAQHLTSHADVEPGAVMTGKVARVSEHGLVVTLTSNIKAFVPTVHLSDLGSKASRSKFKVGQEVRGRVLERNAAAKRILMTLKKALIGSKLPAIAHLEDAIPGSRTHGVVTGMADYGVFVSFYGGVKGMVPAKELPGKPHECFDVGQVVKVRVEAVDAARKRLRLGLVARKAAGGEDGEAAQDELGALQPGDIVQGTVLKSEMKPGAEGGIDGPSVYIVSLVDGLRGRLEEAHLGDHPAAVAALAECIEPGTDLGDLMVLERLENLRMVRLTRKASMMAARTILPATLEDVKEGNVLPGFVASVTPDACFVRFLGHVTGRAGLAQLAGTFVADPRRNFTVNQSVWGQVVQVDTEKKRFSVTLKPGLVGSQDASLLRSLFADLELVAQLRAQKEAEAAAAEVCDTALSIGAVVSGQVHARKEYGVLCDLAAHPDVVGLVTPEQEGAGEHSEGTAVRARVLDVSKAEGIVDLSLRTELIAPVLARTRPARGKRKAAAEPSMPSVGDRVDATVELLKESSHYLVASIPGHAAALGFAASRDQNTFGIDAGMRFAVGQTVQATIAALPDAATGGRMLLTVPLREKRQSAGNRKRKRHERVEPGTIVQGTVVDVHPLHVDVQLADGGPRGRLHITETDAADTDAFAAAFPTGVAMRAVSVGLVSDHDGRRAAVQELTARQEALDSAEKGQPVKAKLSFDAVTPGRSVSGFIQDVLPDHLWVSVSACERGLLVAVESSDDAEEIAKFETRFQAGAPLTCTVLEVDRRRRHLDLTLRGVTGQQFGSNKQPRIGDAVAGKVVSVSGTGVRLQLGARLYGRVPLTDLHDSWHDNALEGLQVGSGVRAKVTGHASDGTLRLSTRPSDGGRITGMAAAPKQLAAALISGLPDDVVAHPPSRLKATDLKINQEVLGYVKGVSKGAFVALAADLDARVKLSALADGFVEHPAAAFPEGRLVRGRVVAIDGSRVELSLRTGASNAADLADLTEGDTVHGTVKKVEPFGVFVRLADSSLTGLAHITELADGFVASVEDAFPVGHEVRAKVLRVDTDAGKLSLGLKPSYFEDDAAGADSEEGEEEEDDGEGRDLDDLLAEELDAQRKSAAEMDVDGNHEEGEAAGRDAEDLQAAYAADAVDHVTSNGVPPVSGPTYTMEVIEGEWDGLLADSRRASTAAAAERARPEPVPELTPIAEPSEVDAAELNKRQRRLEKKRLAAEREAAIKQAEAARQSGDAPPETAEQLEALVTEQPDSSMVWIRYVAYQLSTGDIAAARGIAERALQTINYRNEEDKFNVWLAYLNLENTYGEPPEEAALALFQRAAQYTDAKRMHLAALGVFERSGRDEAVQQLVKAVCRKFGGSAKVWLRAIAVQLHQGDGEGARKTLDRALQSLPRRKHIKVITQTGLLEFKSGSAERGRSIFEGVLRNYPKRLDLWSVYLDQEIKLGDRQRVEALFERAAAMDLPPKKMKFFFKRWSDYEEGLGDAAAVERVKQLATEYIESRQMEA